MNHTYPGIIWHDLLMTDKGEVVSRAWSFNISFNPFYATDLFWYPLKTSENLWFSVFRGYQKRAVAWNRLRDFILILVLLDGNIKKIFYLSYIFGRFSLFLFYLLVTLLIPTHFCIEGYHWCSYELPWPAFICAKLKIKTLEQGVKYVVLCVALVSLLLT